jgi:SAM-dependent methyltransferase
VSDQYDTEHRLLARKAVWTDDAPVRFALEAIAAEEPRRVLDAGCGPGTIGARIAAHVVGVDTSPRMLELAAARGLEPVQADVADLPFDDGSFDCVLAAWMLYHVDPLDRGVAELARVLRPGGLLVAIANGREHLAEMWDRVVPGFRLSLAFTRENGAGILRRSFAHVEQHDFATVAHFDRDAVVRYVGSLSERIPVPEDIEPFDAHGEPTVFLTRR